MDLLEYVDGEPRPTLAPAAVKQLFEAFNKQAPMQHAACSMQHAACPRHVHVHVHMHRMHMHMHMACA